MTDRRWTLMVALLVDCALTTARKIVAEGPEVIRTGYVRERAVAVVARRKALEKAFVQLAG